MGNISEGTEVGSGEGAASMTTSTATVRNMEPEVLKKGSNLLWKGYYAFKVSNPEKRTHPEKSKDAKVFIYNKEAKGIHHLMTGERLVLMPQENLDEFYELLTQSGVRRQFEASAIWTSQAVSNGMV